SSGKISENNDSNNIIPIPLICSKIPKPNKNKKRDIFCSFIGANTHEIRTKLYDQLKNDEKYYIEMDKWKLNISETKTANFKNIMERSLFSLCPRGNGPTSFRLYEAMQLGSIPVYVYNKKWLPYEEELNWLNLCILIHENEISHIKDILENISQERIDFMKNFIAEVYDDWFTLEKVCEKITTYIKNEKMRLLTFYSTSHEILLKNYFLPSLKKINEFDIIAEKFNQIGAAGSYFENGWRESMLQKLKFLVKTVNERWGEYFVFSDVDVIFIDKIKNFLLNEIKKENSDVVFQRDCNNLCAGFFMMKSNEATLQFLNKCIDTYQSYPQYDDQDVMRVHAKTMLNYKLLPDEIFNISMINNGKVWDGEYYEIPRNILAFHANWTIGVKAKIDLFKHAINSLKSLAFLKQKNLDLYFHTFKDGSVFVGDIQSGRMIEGHYLKEENKIILSDNKNSNKKLKVNVYFNYFEAKSEQRNKEIIYCLDQLILNKKIDKIYLICSDEYKNKLNKKITKINMFNIQPTFNDMFNIINFNTKADDLNILLNSDCYIDEENIDIILENITSNTVYCLSRWNIEKIQPFKTKHYDIDCSQDAWIFKGGVHNVNADFQMGVVGCDNAIAFEFEKANFYVSNPSKDIKIYHYHFSEIRTHGVLHEEKEKNRIKRQYKFIPSSFLKGLTPPTHMIKESNLKELNPPTHMIKESNLKETIIPEIKSQVNKEKIKNKRIKVNIYFNYYKSTLPERTKEIKFCLSKLINNKEISRLFLLCNDNINIKNNKVFKTLISDKKPTYKEIFNLININSGINDINIIVNSDCYIDEKNIKLIKENISNNQVYCLSRWNITNLKTLTSEHFNKESSQDAWVFRGMISDKINGNYMMGIPGCDNAIAFEFNDLKYEVLNPSLDIKVFHVHLSGYRTYKEKDRLRMQYKFVEPSKLKLKINDQLKTKETEVDESPSTRYGVKIHSAGSGVILELPPEMSGAELKQFKQDQQSQLSELRPKEIPPNQKTAAQLWEEEVKQAEKECREPRKRNMQSDGGIIPGKQH
ncbi:exostosin family protein, partial [Candidatus Gracilibacteria bacterium]|nr:exostosin family protein [Candidatus Gracilibacteria bacterium]